ncbi:hypothetical protein [Leifsonia sp. 2MCAF36]
MKIAADKTVEIHEAADQFIEDARAHVARLDAEQHLGTDES